MTDVNEGYEKTEDNDGEETNHDDQNQETDSESENDSENASQTDEENDQSGVDSEAATKDDDDLPAKPRRNSRNKNLQRKLKTATIKAQQLEDRIVQLESKYGQQSGAPSQQNNDGISARVRANAQVFQEELKDMQATDPEIEREVKDILSNPNCRNPLSKLDAEVGKLLFERGVSPHDIYQLSKDHEKDIRQLVMNGSSPRSQVSAINLLLDEMAYDSNSSKKSTREMHAKSDYERKQSPAPMGYIKSSNRYKDGREKSATDEANDTWRKAIKARRK